MSFTSKAFALAATSAVVFGSMAFTSAPAEAGWRRGYRAAPIYRHAYAGPRYAYGRHYGYGRGWGHRRGWGGAGPVIGAVAGLAAVGALAAAATPAYSYPADPYPAYGYEAQYAQPAYGYQPAYYAPRCHVRLQTVWSHRWGGYVQRRVRVCH